MKNQNERTGGQMGALAMSDKELQATLIKNTLKLRRKIDAIAETNIRQFCDEKLCEIYLMLKDGHLGKMNGGAGRSLNEQELKVARTANAI